MVSVGRGIKNEAFHIACSAMKNVYTIDEAHLRIANPFFQVTRLNDCPRFAIVVADGMIHFAFNF